ncbi:MAG TPA: hypothetical protein PLF48_11565 [Chitinophagales bacterium]|nr:hypothetical protein [Chitinophagales bacterium]
MRIFFFLLILMLSGFFKSVFAQDDIVLDLDSIKNIKTTRYSTINEVGANINVSGMMIQKLPGTQKKTTLQTDKPGMLFRTVHGALINPNLFIGAGTGFDFRPNGTNGTSYYFFTFPFFAESREYFLNGSFRMFAAQRLGASLYVDSYYLKYYKKTSSKGAFMEILFGGRYVKPGKNFALHFSAGYRFQHLQRKVDVQSVSGGTNIQIYSNTPEITLKHYIPITIGITY